jgi:hypothetical protein
LQLLDFLFQSRSRRVHLFCHSKSKVLRLSREVSWPFSVVP